MDYTLSERQVDNKNTININAHRKLIVAKLKMGKYSEKSYENMINKFDKRLKNVRSSVSDPSAKNQLVNKIMEEREKAINKWIKEKNEVEHEYMQAKSKIEYLYKYSPEIQSDAKTTKSGKLELVNKRNKTTNYFKAKFYGIASKIKSTQKNSNNILKLFSKYGVQDNSLASKNSKMTSKIINKDTSEMRTVPLKIRDNENGGKVVRQYEMYNPDNNSVYIKYDPSEEPECFILNNDGVIDFSKKENKDKLYDEEVMQFLAKNYPESIETIPDDMLDDLPDYEGSLGKEIDERKEDNNKQDNNDDNNEDEDDVLFGFVKKKENDGSGKSGGKK